jgi:hypothetical protein
VHEAVDMYRSVKEGYFLTFNQHGLCRSQLSCYREIFHTVLKVEVFDYGFD